MSVVQDFDCPGVDGGGLFEVVVAWSSMLSLGTGTGCGGYKREGEYSDQCGWDSFEKEICRQAPGRGRVLQGFTPSFHFRNHDRLE